MVSTGSTTDHSARGLNVPPRLLMGPGPITVDPRVLQAMSNQLVGQFDPWMTEAMTEVMGLYRQVFKTTNEQTFLVDGTSRSGIEAALVSLLEPGDRVLVPVFGRFGHLLVEIAQRCRAEVHTVEVPWGEVVTPEAVEEAVTKVRPKLLAIVQGDTSTTMCQPLADIAAIAKAHGVLTYCDATASLGGNPFETDGWGIDVVTAGLQKCLGGFPFLIIQHRNVSLNRFRVEPLEQLGSIIRSDLVEGLGKLGKTEFAT